ncbi:MAG: DUF45 domain-containing protein [Bacteroidales bacterium]|nr:DUF45 domain-containing protein [Bacteroidales bacterium]
MSIIGNLIWLVLGGLVVAIIYFVVGHELALLKVQSHNKLFEVLLTQKLPAWMSLRIQLNEFLGCRYEIRTSLDILH